MKAYIGMEDWADEGNVFCYSVYEDKGLELLHELFKVLRSLELLPKEKPKLGQYCSITTPFCNFGTVPFLTGLYNAYTHHCPLKFSPDDFWLLIIQDFSYYVNAHAKKLRKQLVTFEGRKEIKAYIPKFTKEELTKSDYKDATSLVISKIPNFLQNKTILDTMTQQFSKSTTDILHVKQITAMNTLKSYFYY